MMRRILVANRGEIACRVIASAAALGFSTVAVYSDVDADSPHVSDADFAVRLPGAAPADTYLRGDLIIAAARKAGADAIHPGYGFLSENAGFATAVIEAGLCWIGPPPTAVELMGDKIEAKKLMAAAGVPVLADADPSTLTAADLPVLIKASAGGGGRGMRIVRDVAELPDQLASAQREAQSAFGDPTVFCERYLEAGHHIEVQILADQHGTIWTVGERECSIQRQYQKVIEEAPAPLVERLPTMRARLFQAAHNAAAAVRYVGAGTVEFLADDNGEFHFLEMNTRLQVEHPVTELTTGLDLVGWQLRIACGERLDERPPPTTGAAIEVRLYAQEGGTLHRFHLRGSGESDTSNLDGDVRVDAGVRDGSVIGTHYDPMLAKVIAWAPTRAAVARQLATALARATIHGVSTNRDLLVTALRHPAFLAGVTTTAFLTQHDLTTAPSDERLPALAAALADAAVNRAGSRFPSGWRNVTSAPQRKTFDGASGRIDVDYRLTRTGNLLTDVVPDVDLIAASPESVVLSVAGVRRTFAVARYGEQVYIDSPDGSCVLRQVPRFADPADLIAAGSLLAPMPGTVIRLGASLGDSVTAGQPLLWLEAMKMEHLIAAPTAGVLTELHATVGQQVAVGSVLAIVQEQQS